MDMTQGVLFVHSAPRALCPHIEWAAGGAIGAQAKFDWSEQPAAPGQYRAEICWKAPAGSGARVDGGRWSHTPALGIYHAVTDAHGNIVVPEDVIRTVLARSAGDPIEMATEMERVLGQAWDDELESFRYAGDGAPVRWLTKVG
jgi:hypothetical protein